jgi:hypothetical protein
MAEVPTEGEIWVAHLDYHFVNSEKLEGETRICGWGGCGREISKKGWTNHSRGHDIRFYTACPTCGRTVVITCLEAHIAKAHSAAANDGASGKSVGDDDV